MTHKKITSEELCSFIRKSFNIRSKHIPIEILRRLLIRSDIEELDISEPQLQPFRNMMDCIIALYERRLHIKIKIATTYDYIQALCSKGFQYRLCCFLEYVFDAENRTVYIEKWEYERRMLTMLDYAKSILHSRNIGRRSINNIKLFRIHAYPTREIVAMNVQLTCGSPFLKHGNCYLMYHPDSLRKTRYWFNKE